MEKKKLKVVWLCHFSNKELQDKIKPIKRVNEYAPWISDLIKIFEKHKCIELQIIAQHDWLPNNKYFEKNGIKYNIVKKGIPLVGRHWPRFFRFDIWTDFYFEKRKVKRIVNRINPDLIHLHGTENEYSIIAKQFYGLFPVFITIQGLVSNANSLSKLAELYKRNEITIIKLFKNYGYRTKTMGLDIKKINPKAKLYWHKYPLKKIQPIDVEKTFDVVFFARITKEKGIIDLIKAIAIIKNSKPEVRLCVIGGNKTKEFEDYARKDGVEKNIIWAGFLPTQSEVHQMASRAKISVLPTYNDIVSGTIIESLFLKLPVVAYNVGSIHEVNEKDVIISLVDKLDVAGLAMAIEHLLDNPDVIEERAEKGYLRVQEMFSYSDEEIRKSLLDAYQKVINDFNPLS